MAQMIQSQGERLAAFSAAVRESTTKRLALVPPGSENWKPDDGAMSFADLAQHLLDADRWLFRMLATKGLARMVGKTGLAPIGCRDDYLRLLEELKQTGDERKRLFERLSDGELDEEVHDERFGGPTKAWWVILRGNLDHEIHHRGQIAAYLRMIGSAEGVWRGGCPGEGLGKADQEDPIQS